MTQNRVPAGVRSGGQFANGDRSAPTINLGLNPDDAINAGRDGTGGRPASVIILELGPGGAVRGETNLVRGMPADRPDGTPAEVWFHPDGSIESWRRAGAAERTYFPTGGTVSHVDPRDGSQIAISGSGSGRCIRRGVVAQHEPGTVQSVGLNGAWQSNEPVFEELRDGPGDDPAVSYLRPDGTTSSFTRYTDGRWTHTVDHFPDGRVAVVFSNPDNPIVEGFPADDPVWADIGLEGRQWQGVQPNDALSFADAGVDPDEARAWSRERTGMDAPIALKWRRQGYSPAQAVAETAARRSITGWIGRS